MTNALPEDETTFTCVAKNSAGEVAKSFKLKVLGNLNKDQSTKMHPGPHKSELVMYRNRRSRNRNYDVPISRNRNRGRNFEIPIGNYHF